MIFFVLFLSFQPLFLSSLALNGQSTAIIFYPVLHIEVCGGSGELLEVCCDLWAPNFVEFVAGDESLLKCTVKFKALLANTFWV